VLYSVSIAPAAPAEGDDVVATPGGTSGPEGDTVTVAYAWWVGGTEIAAAGATLRSDDFAKGDAIYVVATPNDGTSDGAPVTSNIVLAASPARWLTRAPTWCSRRRQTAGLAPTVSWTA
jgi:hypothetical protein